MLTCEVFISGPLFPIDRSPGLSCRISNDSSITSIHPPHRIAFRRSVAHILTVPKRRIDEPFGRGRLHISAHPDKARAHISSGGGDVESRPSSTSTTIAGKKKHIHPCRNPAKTHISTATIQEGRYETHTSIIHSYEAHRTFPASKKENDAKKDTGERASRSSRMQMDETKSSRRLSIVDFEEESRERCGRRV